MSGKKSKAARHATAPRNKSGNRATENAVFDRQRLMWPLLAFLVVGLIAFGALRHNGSGASASKGGDAYPYAVGSPAAGTRAPAVSLPSTSGGMFSLASSEGRAQVLLYFQEGLSCQPCWDQIAAIQKDRAKFTALGIGPIVSITTDPLNLIKQKASDEGLNIPVLSDEGGRVSDTYNARSYGMMGHDRDGHSFILVGKDGRIRWRADYGGAPKYTMFVPDDVLVDQLTKATRS